MRLTKLRIFDLLYDAYHAWPRIFNGIIQLFSLGQWERWQGKLLLRMAKKNYIVTGIELRAGMAYEARRKVKKVGLDIDILHQPVYNLPFKDETFDCIVLTFVLAEIVRLDQAICEMKRVLKKGGKIIIIAGGMPQDKNLIAKILFKLVGTQTTLRLERDNKSYFEKHEFMVTRKDFGPFNIINKVVAIKK